MFLFKLFSFLFLLGITIYTGRRYAALLTNKQWIRNLIYILLIILQIGFTLRFLPTAAVLKYPFLKHLVLLLCSLYFTLIALSFLFFFIIDLLYLFNRKSYKQPHRKLQRKRYALAVVLLSLLLSSYGFHHAKQIKVKEYEHTIYKDTTIDKLNIIFISDLHLGTSTHSKELEKLVETINESNPDLVLFGGDIFDENTSTKDLNNTIPILKNITSTYGSYYVYGNHEFYEDSQERYESVLNQSDIAIIEDESIAIDDAFTLVGRLDVRRNVNRKSMEELLTDVDTSKPVIVLDHQPIVDESTNIDLQLSGHTHNGQLFPVNYLIYSVYEKGYGFYSTPYPILTSSGAGTWGIPMRIGSNSEIVEMHIQFK